jgi:hypothetical protein
VFFIAFVPPSKIGQGYARFHTALALVLWLIACRAQFTWPFALTAALLALALVCSARDIPYYLFLVPAFISSMYLLILPDLSSLGLGRCLLVNLPGVLVLGGSSAAMLLGHWYLVAPGLSISYLKVVTIGLIVALIVRSGGILNLVLSAGQELKAARFFDVYGIFFLQRVVLGLLLTLLLSVMTYFCVRIRSTQSATGILYVVLVFCLVGEVIGSYLFHKTGLWF